MRSLTQGESPLSAVLPKYPRKAAFAENGRPRAWADPLGMSQVSSAIGPPVIGVYFGYRTRGYRESPAQGIRPTDKTPAFSSNVGNA